MVQQQQILLEMKAYLKLLSMNIDEYCSYIILCFVIYSFIVVAVHVPSIAPASHMLAMKGCYFMYSVS